MRQSDICQGRRGHTTPLYNSDGEKISDKEARKILDEGGIIEDPNASAHCFTSFALRMGLGRPEVLDWTSSAGDWCFDLPDDGRVLIQTNRYPYFGFMYALGEKDE